MSQLFDLVGFTTTTTGTGTITVAAALSGHRTMAGASIADGTVVSYGISSNGGAARETGTGTVGGSGTTLTRTLSASSTGALLNLSGTSEVYITPIAADMTPGGTTGSLQMQDAAANFAASNISQDASGRITVAAGTQTTAGSALSLNYTANNGAAPINGLLVNCTDTASSGSSAIFDLQYGGVSALKLQKFGIFSVGVLQFYGPTNNLNIGSSIGSFSILNDTFLFRDSANVYAQRNGVNAQTFRVYNTFTDASNYERGFFSWVSNVFRIGTEAAGTGSVRSLSLSTGGSERVNVSASGLVTASTIDVISGGGLTFSNGYELRSTSALRVSTPSDGVVRLMSWGNVNGVVIESVELAADPAAPAANAGRLYFRDNGSGKTQLCVRFATGAVQVIATEP